MTLLDSLLSPTISDDATVAISEDERLIYGTSSESGESSTDSSSH